MSQVSTTSTAAPLPTAPAPVAAAPVAAAPVAAAPVVAAPVAAAPVAAAPVAVPAPVYAAPPAPPSPPLPPVNTQPVGQPTNTGSSVLGVILGLAAGVLILTCAFVLYFLYVNWPTTTTTNQSQQSQQQPAVTQTATAPGTTTVTPGTVQPAPAPAAPGTTQVAPGATVVTPGTTQVTPGTTIVTPGTTQVAPPPAGQPIYAVDPVLLGKFATSSVESTDATLVTVRKHKDNKDVIFVGPGKHLPRKIIVASCPQIAPIQVNVPVPSVENKIYIPQPPVPPTAPVAPTAPSAPVAPQVQQQTSVPVAVGVPVRQTCHRNYGN